MTDVFDEHYRLVCTDEGARRRLVAHPAAELAKFFGSPLPDGPYQIEVIEQREDTVTAILPMPPGDVDNLDVRSRNIAGHVLDLLYTKGFGGFLIPSEELTWVLRDMRSRWANRASE